MRQRIPVRDEIESDIPLRLSVAAAATWLDCNEVGMAENKFLTAEEVSQRYRKEISVGTLRNWRAMRIGPAFVTISFIGRSLKFTPRSNGWLDIGTRQ
jgi:hypothetical protein